MKNTNILSINVIKRYFHNPLILTGIISLLSLSSIFLNSIIGFKAIVSVPIINLFYLFFVYGSSIYILLFLPFYPLFFHFLKDLSFTFTEKLTLTIIFNLSFYILLGYFGFILGIELNPLFFLLSVLIIYLSIFLFAIIYCYKFGNIGNPLGRDKISHVSDSDEKKKLSNNELKMPKLSLNAFLMIILILLACILNVVRVSYFYGTDPWLHISIIKIITEKNIIPIGEYYGTVGLHIFCGVFEFFTQIDTILIPKYFVFYTIPISALVFYIFLKKIFKNKNLAFFGVFILEISSLGFDYMMFQFWPSSIVILQLLTIFYLLYSRLSFTIKNPQNLRKSLFNRKTLLIYGVCIPIFISALLSHSLTSMVLLLTFLWVFFIYFIRDYRRGFDFILLAVLGIIFILLFNFGIGSRHFWFLSYLSEIAFPIIFLSFSLVVGISGLLIWQIYKSIDFNDESFYKTLKGEINKKINKVEEKYFIPILIGSLLVFTSLFILGNIFIFTVNITFIFSIMQTILIITICIWGIVIFQKKAIGKPIMIWLIGFFIVLIGVLIFDLFISGERYFERILYMMAPTITIGFISYVYKLIRIGKIQKFPTKAFILSFVIFALLSSLFQAHVATNDVSLKKKEVVSIQWYSDFNSKKAVIITEFGLNNIFIYYDYPYNGSEIIRSDKTHYYIDYREELFQPEKHINQTGENILKFYKRKYNSNVYITIDDQYYLNIDLKPYGYLSEEELQQYYELVYINKIYSSKSVNGDENPLYWVI